MPKLYLIEAEARRLAGKLPESKRRALQEALIELCEAHWRDIRGPEPTTHLARALWSVSPPLAELFVDLHAAGAARLADPWMGSDRRARWRCWCSPRPNGAMPKACTLPMRR